MNQHIMNQEEFDLWAGSYDKSVGLSDQQNTYPFAGYRQVLNEIYRGVLSQPAKTVLDIMQDDTAVNFTYPDEMPLKEKVLAVAQKVYRAKDVTWSAPALKTLAEIEAMGYGNLPVCIAKTQYSFSDDAKLLAAPSGFTMTVRDVRLSAGAGFVVVIMGSIMTMPGLPKKPAAENIDVDENGKITGLF